MPRQKVALTSKVTKEEAREIYRRAWAARCLAVDPQLRRVAEDVMDDAQPYCVGDDSSPIRGPGPEWEAFIDTLPGYRESWARFSEEAAEMLTTLRAARKR